MRIDNNSHHAIMLQILDLMMRLQFTPRPPALTLIGSALIGILPGYRERTLRDSTLAGDDSGSRQYKSRISPRRARSHNGMADRLIRLVHVVPQPYR